MTIWRRSAIGDIKDNDFLTKTLDITYSSAKGALGMKRRWSVCATVPKSSVHEGYNIIILSDRAGRPDRIRSRAAGDCSGAPPPDPQGPAHLGGPRGGNRRAARSAPVRHPGRVWRRSDQPLPGLRHHCSTCTPKRPRKSIRDEVVKRYIKAIDKGILKVMSKMGISTYQSYCGAQIFDAVGLSPVDFVDTYFTGTATQVRRRRA
jgi:glutamate synthase (NADPH/NADH) large chain